MPDEPADLTLEIVGVEVGMTTVLGRLALGHREEEEMDVPRILGRRLDRDLAADVLGDPAERIGPELGESLRVVGIERERTQLQSHDASLPCPPAAFVAGS